MTSTVAKSIEYLKPLIEAHFTTASLLQPLIIGISGPQGSGKSYLSSHISQTLSTLYPTLTTIDISTDDFYLTFEDQQHLQSTQQPQNWMLSGRGPPGTHDLPLLNKVLSKIRARETGVVIPRYDKSQNGGKGDRYPESQWTKVDKSVDILIVEGWFNGFRSLGSEMIISRWNEIISHTTTRYTNLVSLENVIFLDKSLQKYEQIWDFFNFFIFLSTDNLQNVYHWRLDQEHALKQKNGGFGMTDPEVEKFIDRYMPCYQLYYEILQRKGCLKEKGKNLKLEIDLARSVTNVINL